MGGEISQNTHNEAFAFSKQADGKQNRHMSRACMLASACEVSKKNDLVKEFVENQLSSGKISTLSYLMSRNRS